MYFTAELVLKSYMPKYLEKGMWFINKLHQDTLKETVEIWSLDYSPQESLEEFVSKHGAPVEPYLIYEDDETFGVLAEPHEIGWWDEGEITDELRDIELKDVNLILNEFDGYVDVEVDDDDLLEDEVSPVLYAGKVTLCVPGMYEEEEEVYDDDYEEEPWDDMDDDTWQEP